MQRSFLFKVSGIIIAVGAVSFAVTSGVATHMKRAKAGVGLGDEGTVQERSAVYEAAPGARAADGAQKGKSGATMHAMNAAAEGDVVQVHAVASLYDSKPGKQYVWALRLLDPADEGSVLFEKLYDQHVFSLPPSLEMQNTFDDAVKVPLAPGKYIVELTWFAFSPDDGIAALENPINRNMGQGPVGRATIELGAAE